MIGKGAQQTLNKRQRLRQNSQFEEIYCCGSRVKGPHFSICYQPNKLGYSRLGISVGKKKVKLSVQRHRIQRLLRESFRRNQEQFLPGYDLVIAWHYVGLVQCRLQETQGELLALAKRAQLIRSKTSTAGSEKQCIG